MNLQKNRQLNSSTNKLTIILFAIYLLALFWILLFKLGVRFSYMGNRSVNLVPFREALYYGIINRSEVIANVVIFIPLGIYAGILFQRQMFAAKLLFFFLVSLFFEGIQYGLRIGVFDVTDIITNTSGGLIGWMLYKVIKRAFNDSVKTQRFVNFIAATGTGLMILLLALLKLNMLPVRYQ